MTAPTFVIGSGNFQAGQAGDDAAMQQIAAAGSNACRLISYALSCQAGQSADPAQDLPAVQMAEQYGLRPYLLFDCYGQYGWPTFGQCKAVGEAYARYYGDRILVYSAFNEPDGDGPNGTNIVGGPKWPAHTYQQALFGFAAGVKSVDQALLVGPGGFCKPNSMSDATCGGYGPAIADLFNDGFLDVLDLHNTMNGPLAPGNAGPAPEDLTYSAGGAQFSLQDEFASVKSACGITSDPMVASTEWNYLSPTDLADGGRGFLTAFFDVFCVVGDDGRTPKTLAGLVWQIQTLDTARLQALSVALTLQGSARAALDPSLPTARRTGVETFTLPDGTKAWVWTNRAAWSSEAGDVTLAGVPAGTVRIEVWDATGHRPDLDYVLPTAISFPETQAGQTLTMPADQTLLFFARATPGR
jgi:hypothetical protein